MPSKKKDRVKIGDFRNGLDVKRKNLREIAAGKGIFINSRGYLGKGTTPEQILNFCRAAWEIGYHVAVRFPNGEEIAKNTEAA